MTLRIKGTHCPYTVLFRLTAHIAEFAQQLPHDTLLVLFLMLPTHPHLHPIPAIAVQQQHNVFDPQAREAQHAHALRHVVQHVIRYAGPRSDYGSRLRHTPTTMDGVFPAVRARLHMIPRHEVQACGTTVLFPVVGVMMVLACMMGETPFLVLGGVEGLNELLVDGVAKGPVVL